MGYALMKRLLAVWAIWATLILTALQPAQAQVAACSQALHDSYKALGPDGQFYPTWHPAIDPVSGCSFGHEHGSNPANFDARFRPAYGYVSTVAGAPEPHVGFKTYVFSDYSGHSWMITQHFGTAGIGRVCARFHEVEAVVKSDSTGEIIGEFNFLGDFGPAVVNTNSTPYAPANCETQYQEAVAQGSTGIRMIPDQADSPDPTHAIQYEAWQLDTHLLANRFDGKNFSLNTTNGMTACIDFRCASLVKPWPAKDYPYWQTGTRRHITVYNGMGIKASAGGDVGAFYTDSYGRTIVPKGTTGALYNYVSPGYTSGARMTAASQVCYISDFVSGGKYLCNQDGVTGDTVDMTFENAINQGPN